MNCNTCKKELSPYAFKVFYIGSFYSGFQRQPHGFTIEDFLEDAFINQGYICNFSTHHYRAVSRTDVGVNAISNVFFVYLPTDPELAKLNSALPLNQSIILLGWAKITISDLYPIRYKIYRYFIPSHIQFPSESFHLFSDLIGTYDFTPFIKKDKKAVQNNICTIYSIEFEPTENGLVIQFVGDHFGWRQIRKMVGYFVNPQSNTTIDDILLNQSQVEAPPFPGELLTLFHIQFSTSPSWKTSPIIKLINKRISHLEQKVSILKWHHSLFRSIIEELQS